MVNGWIIGWFVLFVYFGQQAQGLSQVPAQSDLEVHLQPSWPGEFENKTYVSRRDRDRYISYPYTDMSLYVCIANISIIFSK